MKLKVYVFTLLSVIFSIQLTYAQYLSVRGDFEVNQQLGCNDLTVTVTNITPGTGAINYQYEGISSAVVQDNFYTYTTPGSYTIIQTIAGNGGNNVDSVEVIVVAPELPMIELLSCNNFELLLQINDNYYDVYEVDYGDGTVILVNSGSLVPPYTYANNLPQNVSVTGLFTTATNRCGATTTVFIPEIAVLPAKIDSLIAIDNTTIKLDYQLPLHSINKLEVSINNNTNYTLFKNITQNTVIDTITNLNSSQNTYCFRIATYDACSNFKSYSNEVCSVDLTTTVQNNQITSNWVTLDLAGGQSTDLYRDGSLIQTFASAITQHVDYTVVCNTTYCYQIETIFNGGGLARSLEICETSFSTDIPPTIENISSTTNSDSITWTWEVPVGVTPSSYLVHTVYENGSIIDTNSSLSNSYNAIFANEIKYIAVELLDICYNASSISNIGSNIFLQGKINQSKNIEMVWNSNLGWTDGIQEYIISIKDSQGNLIDSLSTGLSTNYTLNLVDQTIPIVEFTIWAIPIKSSILLTKSNVIRIERSPIISIPNSFTPNADGLNDQFKVYGKFITSYEMQIFNRWGEVLFSTNEIDKGWDGTSKGKKMPVGNYAYWMRIKDLSNNEHIRTGSILILSN